jgi:GxxExxY protein
MSPLIDHPTKELTYSIIGAAMAVHNAIGLGYKEEVYEKALAVELATRGIPAISQFPVTVTHNDEVVALFYLDLFVSDTVVVEVKALSHLLTNDERAQVINYLKAVQASIGLLLNFGRRKLEYQRIFPAKSRDEAVDRLGRDDVRKAGRIDQLPDSLEK